MEGTIGLPRDLFAGVLAGKLMEDGYFDEEYQYSGCAYWLQDKVQYLISPDQDLVCKANADFISKGVITSPVMNFFRRVQINGDQKLQTEQRLLEEFKKQLEISFPLKWFALLVSYARVENEKSAFPLLNNYGKSLVNKNNGYKFMVFKGLVEMARIAKTLDADSAQMLLGYFEEANPAEDEEELDSTLFGLAYFDEKKDTWKYYTNFYQPGILTKKYQLAQQNILTTPLIAKNYSLKNSCLNNSDIKADFETLLRGIFDSEYLDLLKKLHALPAVINKKMFKQETEKISYELLPVAKEALNAYAFQWHVN